MRKDLKFINPAVDVSTWEPVEALTVLEEDIRTIRRIPEGGCIMEVVGLNGQRVVYIDFWEKSCPYQPAMNVRARANSLLSDHLKANYPLAEKAKGTKGKKPSKTAQSESETVQSEKASTQLPDVAPEPIGVTPDSAAVPEPPVMTPEALDDEPSISDLAEFSADEEGESPEQEEIDLFQEEDKPKRRRRRS